MRGFTSSARVVCVVALLTGWSICKSEEAVRADRPEVEPRAGEVLKACSDYLAGLSSFSVRVFSRTAMGGAELPSASPNVCHIFVVRPARVSLLMEGRSAGRIISDGRKLYVYSAAKRKYIEKDAPKTLGGLAEQSEVRMVIGWPAFLFVMTLLAEDPQASIMEGVTALHYKGTEALDSVQCHHLRGEQEHFDWDLWIETGPKPVIRRVVPDMSKAYKARDETVAGTRAARVVFPVDFDDWQANPEPADGQFTFIAPDGAEKVDSLFGDMFEDEGPHSLTGEPAPDLKLKLLGGGELDLSVHKGKHVVVLDFWATWCPPCVQGLPSLAKLAKAYEGKDVVVYAVNEQEEADTIRQFLKQRKLDLKVALDSEGRAGDLYELSGIPQTVIIDKKGVVQAVHNGFGAGTEKQIESDIESVLAGKDLAAEARKRAESREPPEIRSDRLQIAWFMPGKWEGVAADPVAGVIYAVSFYNRGVRLDAAGKELGRLRLGGQPRNLRTANLRGDARCELLAFRTWGETVVAYAGDGSTIWEYACDGGVDDVWAADLDGDGFDEVVIGHNGSAGLHVLGPDGKLKWKDTDIGNVWHVCVGDVNGDGKPEVVSTSAVGQLHVFDAAGDRLAEIETKGYSTLARVARLRAEDKAEAMITEATSLIWGNRLFAVGMDGQQQRLAGLPRGHVGSAAVAATRPWMAVAMRDGQIRVVDLGARKTLGSAELEGHSTEVAWLDGEQGDDPLLLVANGRGVFAFRVTGHPSPTSTRAGS